REEAWIQTVTPSCSHFLTLAARRAGFEPRIAFETDVYEAVLGLVAAGVGVALVPELALDSVPDGVAIRPIIEPSPMRYIDAVLPLAPAPAAVAFLEALRDESSRRARVAGQEVRALPVAG
ncbi:MAG: LysR family transcriptional regulator, partial [Solirubrobacterales bacterium]|nr:LysR family transcriptional regulator [Solirubrobacterales bacterium]